MRPLLTKTPGFARLPTLLVWLIATSAGSTLSAPHVKAQPTLFRRHSEAQPKNPRISLIEPQEFRNTASQAQRSPASAEDDAPVEIGGYGMLGGAIEDTPPPHTGHPIGAVGLYAQWNRYGLCPGLDLRLQGNEDHLHGYLVGPRVAYQPRSERLRPFRLYAEGLFGKNEVTYSPDSSGLFTTPATEHAGVTRSIVFGLDLHASSPFDWRVIEFSKGDFTGLHGSYPQTVMTGILIHLP